MRTEKILIRLSKEEKQRIEEQAEHAGVSVSEYLRSVALQQKVRCRKRKSKIEKDFVLQLARIGNNLNQLARIANKTHNIEALIELAKIEKVLKGLLEQCT